MAHFGHIVTEETRRKLSLFNKGKKNSDITRKRISNKLKLAWSTGKKKASPRSGFQKGHKQYNSGRTYWKKGQRISPATEFKKGHLPPCAGKKRPEFSGVNHPNWCGGRLAMGYPEDWTAGLKESIRERDGYACQECGVHQDELNERLHVHHIDYDKKNCNPDNLITLCRVCHCKTNYNREYWIEYFNRR